MKKIIFMTICFLLFFSWNGKVEADLPYLGEVDPGDGTTGETCDSTHYGPMRCNNMHFGAIKITFRYYQKKSDGTYESFLISKRPYYIVGNTRNEFTKALYSQVKKEGKQVKVGYSHELIKGGAGPQANGASYNPSVLRSYSEEAKARKLLSDMGVDLNELTFEHNEEPGLESYGYRFVLEPVLQWILPPKDGGGTRYMTVKEIFEKYNRISKIDNTAETAGFLHLSPRMFTGDKYGYVNGDVGIKGAEPEAATYGPDNNVKGYDSPYGMHLIVPPATIFKKCFSKTVTCYPLTCDGNEKQHTSTCETNYKPLPKCPSNKEKDEEERTEKGKLEKTKNNCKIYCKESVTVTYPGSIEDAIKVGTYFIWPTFKKIDSYNLNIEGKKTCTPVGDSCNGLSLNQKEYKKFYNNFKSDIKLEYDDPEYGKGKEPITLKTEKTEISCNDCNKLTNNKSFDVTINVSKKLPTNKNQYIYKTGESSNKKLSTVNNKNGTGTEIKINQGILSVSKNANVTKKYNLKLKTLSLGSVTKNAKNGTFAEAIKKANWNKYNCKYKVTDDTIIPPPGSCKCDGTYNPPNTGTDISELLCEWKKTNNTNKQNWFNVCINLKEQKCIWKKGDLDQEIKKASEKEQSACLCPGKPEISIKACLTEGKSYDECVSENCNSSTTTKENYTCPKGTLKVGMDISSCVHTEIAKGKKKEKAKKDCIDSNCKGNPGGGPGDSESGGIPIIYRTINLKNPFPSKTANAGIKGFNNDVNGRYPGSNWNSEKLVKTEILNNRGVSNNNIYYNKDVKPLYTIVLDGKTIKKIREYNDKNKYSDFSLTCKNGSACLSNTFLRRVIKITGKCARSGFKGFYTCAK